MIEAPWLTPEIRRLVKLVLTSYQKAYGQPLHKCDEVNGCYRLTSQELFSMPSVVMAHDNQDEPCLTYANSAALHLWGRRWSDMVGMPSRLTAPIDQHQNRKSALMQAMEKHAIKGYQGIRIDSQGRKFVINNARIWTVWDEKNLSLGQAATFETWSHL